MDFIKKLRAVVFFKYSEIEKGYFQLHLLERICTIAGYLSLGRTGNRVSC